MSTALGWKSYSVSKAAKAPLLGFIMRALEMRDCRVLFASEPDRAPFYIVFETPAGQRHGVLAYAFFANAKVTTNRPEDEHRFQVKYGSDLKTILEVAIDPHQLITTIFLGIDPERGIFVAADPLMNTPAPMSRSIEFKVEHVEAILSGGWAAWERDRRPPKSRDRASFYDEDLRTEILVGGMQDRLLDLIALEQIARGLDPGERHLIADKLRARAAKKPMADHALLGELGVTPEALLDLIQSAGRLKMAVRGWVAEAHLFDFLRALPGVSDCVRIEAEGKPDISLRWKGGAPILIECKNSLRATYADGRPKVDFQKTRASKGDPCSRYYRPSDFHVLTACIHAVTDRWEFRHALTRELPPHETCPGRIKNMVAIEAPIFTDRAEVVFDKCSGP
jgi:hypothetical protein